jgi:hypothetical protein
MATRQSIKDLKAIIEHQKHQLEAHKESNDQLRIKLRENGQIPPDSILLPDNKNITLPVLESCGVFVHRRLAEDLVNKGFKLWTNEKEKTAFVLDVPQNRAKILFKALIKYWGFSDVSGDLQGDLQVQERRVHALEEKVGIYRTIVINMTKLL